MFPDETEEHEGRIGLKDFEFVRKIGQGGFGAVWVARKKDTGEALALKVVNKSLIWKKNKVTQMKNERDVLASHLNAWMVQLAYSFQDPHHCYLAMEYCPGGDLRHLLTALGYLEEHEVRLYMAEMILAVFSLHSLGYIHRDLKPDNFLIDSKGHLKLTDFGLSKDGSRSNMTHRRFTQANSLPELSISSSALLRPDTTPKTGSSVSRAPFSSSCTATPLFEPKGWTSNLNSAPNGETLNSENSSSANPSNREIPVSNSEIPNRRIAHPNDASSATAASSAPINPHERAYSVVGSPHYMSPEVLAGEHGYGAEVDWWSLGCILFELVTGSPPFDGETPQQVFDNIIDWRTTLPLTLMEYEETVSPECLDFITKLFLCDAKERFNAKMGLARVFAHPFFKDFSIESIFNLEPPFIPQLKDECDTTYFDTAADRLGTAEDQEKEKSLFEGAGNQTPPTPYSISHTHPIQCPQTAPRRLTHSSRYYSPEDDWSQKSKIPFTPTGHAPFDMDESSLPTNTVSQSHNEHMMFQGLATASPSKRGTASSTKHYGRFTIQRTRALGTYTPLRRRAEAESPRRDIAGFTFQRKKSLRTFQASSSTSQKLLGGDNASSSSVTYDFTSDEAIMRYATARRSPDHFFGSPSSASNDFSTLYITPRALNFEADTNNTTPPRL